MNFSTEQRLFLANLEMRNVHFKIRNFEAYISFNPLPQSEENTLEGRRRRNFLCLRVGSPVKGTFPCPLGCPSIVWLPGIPPTASLVPTVNLQPSTSSSVGPGVRQPLLPFGSCSLAPPRLAFEYNTWPSSSDHPGYRSEL